MMEKIKVCFVSEPAINKRMNFPDAISEIKMFAEKMGDYDPVEIIVEDAGYQKAFFQQLEKEGYPSRGMPTGGLDKRTRLNFTTKSIRSGQILFPREGAEDLITQLVGFGIEKHDDLADAFSMLIRESMTIKQKKIPTSGNPSAI